MSEFEKQNVYYFARIICNQIDFVNTIGLACCGAKVIGAALFSVLGSVMSGIHYLKKNI